MKICARTLTYLGILIAAFLAGKITASVLVLSPYMVFLAIFTKYWGWGKTIVIQFAMYVINESLQATSIVGALQTYWGMAYTAYFMFTLLQVYVIKEFLTRKTKLFQMANLGTSEVLR